ncbi:MAG: hypothetical protein U0790_01130 [Isosphaeraceae bacterium]
MIDLDGSGLGGHVLNLLMAEDEERAFVVSTYDILGSGLESILVQASSGPEVVESRRGILIRLRERVGHEVEIGLNREDARWLAKAIVEELSNLLNY